MKQVFILFILSLFSHLTYAQPKNADLFDFSTVKLSEILTNTPQSDFGSSLVGDSLYFSAYREDLLGLDEKKLKDKEYYDLFTTRIDSLGNAISGRQPVAEFMTRYHDGPVSWCHITGELFVTQSNDAHPSIKYNPFRKEDIKLKIVIAQKSGSKWVDIVEFPFNDPNYSVGQPAINQTGDTLYFSSDMPGGFGKTDIYFSVRKNGKWESPVNMGPDVNTSGSDEFPFITGNSYPGRYLIFASTGHNSVGGFDLFYKKLSATDQAVVRFPEPINSTNDDFAMDLPENVEYGYISSNRPGTGNDDIYKITFEKNIEYLQEIFVLDSKTHQPISGAEVNFCDKKKGETGSDGKFSFSFPKNAVCDVSATAFGYKPSNLIIKIGAPKQGTVLKDTIPMMMIINEKMVLRNIYYDFDRWDILPESAMELDRLVKLMLENPDMRAELSAHTDARGSIQYNMRLSQLRAQSAVDYLVSKGIDAARIDGKGYGESVLINKPLSGERLTPVQHRENRRTELYIPGFLKGENVAQTIGDYASGQPDHAPNYSSYKTHGSIFGNGTSQIASKANSLPYFLIMGSFVEKEYASKFVEQLQRDGFNASVLSESGPYRVGIAYNSYQQANLALELLNSKNHIGWISHGL